METVITQNVITFKSLYQACRDCRKRKRKRSTANAQRYEMHLLDNLFHTQAALQQRSYSPTRSIRFVARKPKAREIHAADFSDRVVHHWLVPRLEALFEPVFIHDVYSNRKGKGTHKAVGRLQSFMHSLRGRSDKRERGRSGKERHPTWNRLTCTCRMAHPLIRPTAVLPSVQSSVGTRAYYLQLDIKNFFNSIDCPILFKLIQQRLRKAVKQGKITTAEADTLRWLSHSLLKHDASQNALYRGNPALLNQLPAYKQLGNAGENKGLPIGNLTSQFFANIYLNPLDQMVKHSLKCRYYLRYVDDFVLLADSRETLLEWRDSIQSFLREELQLSLKEVAEPKPIRTGIDFLGYINYPNYRLVRRRVVGNLYEKLCHFQPQLVRGTRRYGYKMHLKPPIIQKLRATLASYWGHFSHANSFHLRQRIIEQFPWLTVLFEVDSLLGSRGDLQTLQPCWEPKASQISGYKSQTGFFRKHYPLATIAVQRGTEQDTFYSLVKTHSYNNAGNLKEAVSRLFIREQGYYKGGLKRRQLYRLHMQPGIELCPN